LTYATAEHAPKLNVVKVHPYLTRGVGEEALIGLENLPSGTVKRATFRFTLTDCTLADISGLTLWRQPGTDTATVGVESGTSSCTYRQRTLYKQSAASVGAYTMGSSSGTNASFTKINDTEFTVTFGPNTGVIINGPAKDSLWLTLAVKTSINVAATILATVDGNVELSVGNYAVTDDAATVAHKVYPFRDYIGAYYKSDEWHTALPSDAEQRLTNTTEAYVIGDANAVLGDNGEYSLTMGTYATRLLADIKAKRPLYNSKLRIFLVIGKTTEVTAAMTEAKRAAFVKNATAQLVAWGFDGLDIDYEHCASVEQYQNYAATLGDFAIAFFPKRLGLSVAVSAVYRCPPAGALASPDYINDMVYDGGSLNAPYSFMKEHNDALEARNVPLRRRVIGQPMYGNETSVWSQPGWSSVVGWASYTGDDCDAAINPNNSLLQTFTGPTTYRGKVRQCLDWGVGGVMVWGYFCDVDWAHSQSLSRHQAQLLWPRTAYTWATPSTATDGYYLLTTEEDWFWFTENPTHNVRLANEITFTHDPKPIENFSGTLDGNGQKLIFPQQTWIVTYDDSALFRRVSGTIKNLNIDFSGRVISRRDRKIDVGTGSGSAVSLSTKGGAGGKAAVLAAALMNGATLSNVTLTVREGAEIRGQHLAAALASELYCDRGAITVENCTVDFAGQLTTAAVDSLGNAVTMADNSRAGDIGVLLGHINWDGTLTVSIKNNKVLLRPTAKVASVRGQYGAAGGCIGNTNIALAANGPVSGLQLVWFGGASVRSDRTVGTDGRAQQPWIACSRDWEGVAKPALNGGTITAYGTFPWEKTSLWIAGITADTPEVMAPTVSVGASGTPLTTLSPVEAELITSVTLPPATTKVIINSENEANAAYLFTVTPMLQTDGTVSTISVDYAFGISKIAPATVANQPYVVMEMRVQDAAANLAAYANQTRLNVKKDGVLLTAGTEVVEVTDMTGATSGVSTTAGLKYFRVPQAAGSAVYTVEAMRD
ncbi:MAG: glycosyl hydrolase family 18 protein, partial [Kiritimatiellia bacterium]